MPMGTRASKHEAGRILAGYLEDARRLRAARKKASQAKDWIRLKAWQSERLARTHADLLANERYRPATEFFLSELYGTRDFAPRDEEVARVLPLMTNMLPARALVTLGDAVRMDALSESLDDDMVAALRAANCADNITDGSYAEAYRICGRKADRELQIALVDEIGRALEKLTRLPMLYSTLKLMRKPAELAGLGTLQTFLRHGFEAFRHMGPAGEFLDTVTERETRLMEALFAGQCGISRRQSAT